MLEKLRHGWLLLTGKEDLSLNQQMIKVENVHINMPGINGESQSLLAEPHRCIKRNWQLLEAVKSELLLPALLSCLSLNKALRHAEPQSVTL